MHISLFIIVFISHARHLKMAKFFEFTKNDIKSLKKNIKIYLY